MNQETENFLRQSAFGKIPVCPVCKKIIDGHMRVDLLYDGSVNNIPEDKTYDHLCPDCIDYVIDHLSEIQSYLANR